MGTYTDLTVFGYPIATSKSYVIPEVMTLFQETDKRIVINVPARDELDTGDLIDDEHSDGLEVAYICETWKVIDRLNVMGFTMRRVRDEFKEVREAEIEEYKSLLENSNDGWCRDEFNYYSSITFERYSEALSRILNDGIYSLEQVTSNLDPLVTRILEDEEGLFGFPWLNLRSFIRLACELVPKDSVVAQDISEVVLSGYYDVGETVCLDSTRALTSRYPEDAPRIILTEGSTDVEVLKAALTLLYPHLSDYYRFLEFHSTRAQGGAGNLVTTIKAFAAAGITNRIIAIFDNDTAAFDACRSLKSIQLPKNIAVCKYPDLNSLDAYPTLGPSGLVCLNVNGLAASIELYFGSDILANGEAYPIQWKGYIESVGKYQGEVMHKSQLQQLFREKIARSRLSRDEFGRGDWLGMRVILDVIINAFD